MRQALCLILFFLTLPPVEAKLRTRIFHRRSSGFSTRRRLFTSPLITDPGNVDLEFSGAFDTNSSYTLPATLKYTPAQWQTEFSVGVDTLASVVDDTAGRSTHFSDHVNLAATTAFKAGENFSWAIAPTAAIFLRGESGSRLGGALFGRYDRAGNTFSGGTSWNGATRSSATNPAGTLDLTAGYGRKMRRLTAYGNVQWERSTGIDAFYSLFEGVEYEVNDRFAVDLSGAHYGLRSGAIDHQIVLGLTYTLHQHR
ncbi:hypothetical protein [uncultured Paludibaculum sp.]|uniref:hypothetical protein n=1 Tax=uncultured Paludibaculum sp. TaxID=1765020 RepID=UPI002AAB9653|nr:hypothetical protein [uncultured Paludibaculum sp.]